MWFYPQISRQEFEQRKNFVEEIICECGAIPLTIELPHKQKTTSHSEDFQETYYSQRPVFQFHHEYFRVDELLSEKKPFIVIEYGTYDQLIKNIMEDIELFPYDSSDEEIQSVILAVLQK